MSSTSPRALARTGINLATSSAAGHFSRHDAKILIAAFRSGNASSTLCLKGPISTSRFLINSAS